MGDYGSRFHMHVPDDFDAYVRRVPKARRLLRVVPIVQSFSANDGMVTVSSLELYGDGSILRWYSATNNPRASAESRLRAALDELQSMPQEESQSFLMHLAALSGPTECDFALRDDVGTVYDAHPSGGGGDGERWDSCTIFGPAISETAKRLFLEMTLHGAHSRASAPLKHTFVVDL